LGIDRYWPTIYVRLRNGGSITMAVFSVRWGGAGFSPTWATERVETLRGWLVSSAAASRS